MLQESSARLGTAKRALEDVAACFECIVCFEPFDNQHRRVAFLHPCKHEYVDHACILYCLQHSVSNESPTHCYLPPSYIAY